MNLNAANAVEYLRSRGHLPADESARVRELPGGVSSTVIHVASSNGDDLVLKQARAQLKVSDPWYCSVDRIWREVDVLRICSTLIRNITTQTAFRIEVPRLLFQDRENYLYAMSAAPPGHVVWKEELLRGVADGDVATACGALLATLHATSWHDPSLAQQLDDRQFFNDLRLDPYYRQIAAVHKDLAPDIERLIESACTDRHCLVHGDFSPKNLLLHDNRIMLIDFEVGHYGDPAFDIGFFLAHLALKACYHAPREGPFIELIDLFQSAYVSGMTGVRSAHELDSLITRSILHFAGCTLARLDGKSKIDYLRDPARRDSMRDLCRTIFKSKPAQWAEVRLLVDRPFSRHALASGLPS
jgi:5-methylthioribose kinase